MVETKFNWGTYAVLDIFLGFFPILWFLLILFRYFSETPLLLTTYQVALPTLLLVIACTIHFNVLPNFKICISSAGIERKNAFKIGPLVLFEKQYVITWDNVISFTHVNEGIFRHFIAIGNYNGKERIAALINFGLTNQKKAVAEIVKHLPPEKIHVNVIPIIRKWEEKGLV
jgi:hypothetical protein